MHHVNQAAQNFLTAACAADGRPSRLEWADFWQSDEKRANHVFLSALSRWAITGRIEEVLRAKGSTCG